MSRSLFACAAIGLLVATAGCATIVDGKTASVTLQSMPSEANVTVRNHDGVVVAETVTPGEVELKRGRKWLKPAKYTATFEKPGYQTTETPIETKFNPWALGNIVLGGPIGLGVDAASGAFWKPKSSSVEQSLAAVGAPPVYVPVGEDPASKIQMASASDDVSSPK